MDESIFENLVQLTLGNTYGISNFSKLLKTLSKLESIEFRGEDLRSYYLELIPSGPLRSLIYNDVGEVTE